MKRLTTLLVLTLVATLLAACAAPAPEVIEKEVVVEKPVVETVIVEKEVPIEKKVVETVVVEKEVIVEKVPEVAELWYDPADLGKSWVHICPDTPPSYGGTMVCVAEHTAMTGLNWLQETARLNDWFLFSQLIDMDGDGTTIHPDLAKSWEVSEDGKTYTFHLRKGVKFHDGSPLTAEDVKYSFEMYYNKETGSPIRGKSDLAAIVGTEEYDEGSAEEISGIKVLDDYTIQIALKTPRMEWIYTPMGINIWPKRLLEDIPFSELRNSEYAVEHPVGSGPFKMGKFVPDQYYTFEAFEDYYAGRPYLDRIIFRIGLEAASALAALEAREIHAISFVIGEDRIRLDKNPDIVLRGGWLGGAMYTAINKERWPDKRLAKALMYALDRQSITDEIYRVGARPWYLPDLDPEHEWVSPDVAKYTYDPEKAKALLEEMGWDSGQELDFITYYRSDVDQRVIAAMQQYWADVGIKVNVQSMDGPTFVNRYYEEADFDLGYACCAGSSPLAFMIVMCDRFWPQGHNGGRYCNEEYDKAMTTAVTESDPEKRKQLMYKVTEISMDELPYLPLYQLDRVVAASKKLCNWQFRSQVYNIYIKPELYPNTWYLVGE